MVTVRLLSGVEHLVDPTHHKISLTESEEPMAGSGHIEHNYVFDFGAGMVRIKVTRHWRGEIAETLSDVRRPLNDFIVSEYGAAYEEGRQNAVAHYNEGGGVSARFAAEGANKIMRDTYKTEPYRPRRAAKKKHPKAPSPKISFLPGERVVVSTGWFGDVELSCPTRTGTVVSASIEQPPVLDGRTCLLMDQSNVHFGSSDATGKNRCIVVSTLKIVSLNNHYNRHSQDYYKGVPERVGVCTLDKFQLDPNYYIPRKSLGRVLSYRSSESMPDEYLVYFPDAEDEGYSPACFEIEGHGGLRYKTCSWIDAKFVMWCRWDARRRIIAKLSGKQGRYPKWDDSGFTAGKFVRFKGPKPHKFSTETDRTVLNWAVMNGALLRIEASDSGRSGSVRCVIISGCSPDALGTSMILSKECLVPTNDNIIIPGKPVEIVAQINFKGQELQGRKAKVVLARDEDDEVGIELEDNINAGSLDGNGKEGHCLYISEGALRKTE